MRWWRIGNAVLIILVLPLVTYLLNRMLAGGSGGVGLPGQSHIAGEMTKADREGAHGS